MININILHALLFAHGGEMQKKEIMSLLNVQKDELDAIIASLKKSLQEGALEILETQTTLSLRTARVYAQEIEKLHENDPKKDIGSAALEVLSIILYSGSVTRSHIDYMRGVNSSGTLRQLVQRGLIERSHDNKDARAWVYTTTPELFAHLNITNESELPEYEHLHNTLNITI